MCLFNAVAVTVNHPSDSWIRTIKCRFLPDLHCHSQCQSRLKKTQLYRIDLRSAQMGHPIQLAVCFRNGLSTVHVSWRQSKILFVMKRGEIQQCAFSYRGYTSTDSLNSSITSVVQALGGEGFSPEGNAGDNRLQQQQQQVSNRSGPHRKKDTPWPVILAHTRYTLVDAAARLDMSASTLKAICRQHGLDRWPQRLMASALKRTQPQINPGGTWIPTNTSSAVPPS